MLYIEFNYYPKPRVDRINFSTKKTASHQTNVALDVLRKEDVSAAIFAPGWVYEHKQETDFQTAQNK